MEIKVEGQKEKQKITLIAVLLAGSCFLTYYFHQFLQTGTVFTHFFYIPIILASLRWKRKGVAVALFLALFLLFSGTILREYVLTANDYLRTCMFVAIGVAVALLSERIAKTQEKTAHLNKVLYAIRNVNQLITKEKDRDRLLKGACDNLTQTRGYYNAWIALLDEHRDVVTTAESGLGKDFLPMADLLKGGTLTDCGKKALRQSEVVVTKDPLSTCTDCPLSDQYRDREAMTIRLEHEGKIYGIASASTPIDFLSDEEEQSLFQEVAIDIAFALHNIELEEKHKYAEEALQKSEEKYRSLINDVLESSAVGIFILDSDFRVAWVNRALEDYFDVKRDDIIGKDKRQLIRERIKDIFENPDSFAHTVFTTYDDNTYVERFECHVLPDGTREERWLEHQSQPIQSGLYTGGRIEHYYDITARKQAEENLHQSEEKYRSLFEDSKDAIYITSREGKFLDVNRALLELFEYSREEMIDKLNVEEIYVYPGDRDTFQKEIEKNGLVRDYEITFCKKNGTEMHCLLTSTVRRSNEGSILGYQGIIRDITARKQAEKKLTASLKEKEVLLKEVHHRVKNNLQVISSLLSLQSQHIKDKESLEMFQESQSRIRAMALIHEKLYQSEDMARIDIAAYIQDLTAFLFSTYTVSNEIKVNIAVTDIFLIITTAIPCGLIINELVTNALKHAFPHQQDGTITVSMTPSNTDSLILTVSDTGIGFPEGIDFRNTTTLGMQLVISLVEQLDGTITLDRSEGTRFRIEFRKQE